MIFGIHWKKLLGVQMLKPDKFSLLRSFFTEVGVNANPSFSTSDSSDEAKFDTGIDCDKREDGVYIVRFSVSCDDDASPYHFQTEAFAYVQVGDEYHSGDYRETAAAYGVQVLYGMIRDYLEILSNKGPWEQRYSINLGLCDVSEHMKEYKAQLIKEEE